MAKRIITPFAENGDRVQVFDETQANGEVSYNQGYPSQYSMDVNKDPTNTARRVNRDRFNQILHDITGNIQEWQNQLFPDYVPPSENNKVAMSYSKGMVVNFNGVARVSLFNNNTNEPSDAKTWADLFPLPTVLGGTGHDKGIKIPDGINEFIGFSATGIDVTDGTPDANGFVTAIYTNARINGNILTYNTTAGVFTVAQTGYYDLDFVVYRRRSATGETLQEGRLLVDNSVARSVQIGSNNFDAIPVRIQDSILINAGQTIEYKTKGNPVQGGSFSIRYARGQ